MSKRVFKCSLLTPCLLTCNQGTRKMRGIFLDTSKVSNGIPLDRDTFVERFDQLNLRYLKIYDSLCPQQCDSESKVNLPDELKLPFQEIQYLHWLKFPLDKLPPDFNPNNLIDLRLPHSKIERVWETAKVRPPVPSSRYHIYCVLSFLQFTNKQ